MQPDNPNSKRCPACKEWVRKDARECMYCGEAPWYWKHHSTLVFLVIAFVLGLAVVIGINHANDTSLASREERAGH